MMVVTMRSQLVLQFEIVALNIIVAFLILGFASPFEERSQTNLSLANEVFTLLILYHFMCFTPFVQDMAVRIQLGFSFCLLEMANISINLAIAAF